jgi:hypothetical protein
MLGGTPALGRFFTPAEDTKTNGEPYVVITYDCWQTRFSLALQPISSLQFSRYFFTSAMNLPVSAPSMMR